MSMSSCKRGWLRKVKDDIKEKELSAELHGYVCHRTSTPQKRGNRPLSRRLDRCDRVIQAEWVHSYPSGNVFDVILGAVSVAPHGGEHVLVYVRVASPLTQAESRQSQ